MNNISEIRISLPDWTIAYLDNLDQNLKSDEARMQAAIKLAEGNVRHGTGGPFGALVIASATGRPVSMAVNRVVQENCSAAHAEMIALGLAQQRLETWNLADTFLGPMELVCSCEPCAMCLGAIPWSGVTRLVCGASAADAEAVGFDEGDRNPQWTAVLERRGINVTTGLLRDQAANVLRAYADTGGLIYQPGRGV